MLAIPMLLYAGGASSYSPRRSRSSLYAVSSTGSQHLAEALAPALKNTRAKMARAKVHTVN
jgi:hypothetical protein